MAAGQRIVEARGDVYFDVVHDSLAPFTTRALTAIITDIGTRFTVHTESVSGVAMTIREGAVSLKSVNSMDKKALVLRVGDDGLLEPNGRATTRRPTAQDFAWMRR